jgi:hypothetical protein
MLEITRLEAVRDRGGVYGGRHGRQRRTATPNYRSRAAPWGNSLCAGSVSGSSSRGGRCANCQPLAVEAASQHHEAPLTLLVRRNGAPDLKKPRAHAVYLQVAYNVTGQVKNLPARGEQATPTRRVLPATAAGPHVCTAVRRGGVSQGVSRPVGQARGSHSLVGAGRLFPRSRWRNPGSAPLHQVIHDLCRAYGGRDPTQKRRPARAVCLAAECDGQTYTEPRQSA